MLLTRRRTPALPIARRRLLDLFPAVDPVRAAPAGQRSEPAAEPIRRSLRPGRPPRPDRRPIAVDPPAPLLDPDLDDWPSALHPPPRATADDVPTLPDIPSPIGPAPDGGPAGTGGRTRSGGRAQGDGPLVVDTSAGAGVPADDGPLDRGDAGDGRLAVVGPAGSGDLDDSGSFEAARSEVDFAGDDGVPRRRWWQRSAAAVGVHGALFDPGRRGLRVMVLVVLAVVVVAGVVAWRLRPVADPVAAPAAPESAHPTASGSARTRLVVSVAGKVRHPGLVRLPAGARVADAIAAAGGPLPGTDLGLLNLARKVVDGEQILVGVTPSPQPDGAAAPGGTARPAGLVNLNTATEADLDTLPGIGPALAGRIIAYRTEHGGFRSVEELKQVSGIGDARYADLKDLVTV